MASLPRRARGVKVLKAVSSPLRLQILNLLFDKNALAYSELMNLLKMNPSRDAGRFAYHLKFLLKADLIEVDAEAKKYFLTDLGKMVLDVASRVEKKAVRTRGMLVRTSHFTMEEFDANKIANSLIKEAKVPAELAQKAAKEAEKRLLKSKIKYVTAPLVRELVNAILIEKGYEEYRHKLTRLGLPVHEVSELIDDKNRARDSATLISKAGKTVFGEYALLNAFPRDIADAHVCGAIHVDELGTWILKPNEIIHDLRFFLQKGFNLSDAFQVSVNPPQNFEAALPIILDALLHANKDVSRGQHCSCFNVFLAPFAKGVDAGKIRETLRKFLSSVRQHVAVSFGLELGIPKSLAETTAIGIGGTTVGKYGDFAKESRLLASLLIEIFIEESISKPIFNPSLVLKLSKAVFNDEEMMEILRKAHELATEKGTIYFSTESQKEASFHVFSGSGLKFDTDLSGDWETDLMRTGCIGMVTINLPRIVYESEKDKKRFFEILKERVELAARALRIKYLSLKRHGKDFLPFITQNADGDTYFRIQSCSRLINFAGFKEAIEAFCGKSIDHEECVEFAKEVIQEITTFKHKLGRKHGKRLFPIIIRNLEASKRLAELDVEKYGIAKVKVSGNREKPFYSTTKRFSLQQGTFPYIASETLEIEQKLKGLNAGGTLAIIELESNHYSAEELLKLTKHLAINEYLEGFTYNRIITYCERCKKSWFGTLHKCPSCGSMSTLITFDRFAST